MCSISICSHVGNNFKCEICIEINKFRNNTGSINQSGLIQPICVSKSFKCQHSKFYSGPESTSFLSIPEIPFCNFSPSCSPKRSILNLQNFVTIKIVLWNFVNITVGKLGYSYLSLLSNYFNLLGMKIVGKEFSFCKYPTPSFNTFTWGDRYCCKFMQHKQGLISFSHGRKRLQMYIFKKMPMQPLSKFAHITWFTNAMEQLTSVTCL